MQLRSILGPLLAAALAISAAAQDYGKPEPPATSTIAVNGAGDAPYLAAILAVQPQVALGPSDLLRNYERGMEFISQQTYLELAQIADAVRQNRISRERAEYLSQASYQFRVMQFQLLGTLHQILEYDIEKAAQRPETLPSSGEKPSQLGVVVAESASH